MASDLRSPEVSIDSSEERDIQWHLTFAFAVGTGTGKILKGAGQGLGHAFGGGKWNITTFEPRRKVETYTYFIRC